jgi:transcription initiation factor TFIID subunit 5
MKGTFKNHLLCVLIIYSRDHLGVFPTKQTPIYNIQFTDRNLCLASGAFTLQKSNEN